MISNTRSTTSINEALIDAESRQRVTQNSVNVERKKSTRIDEPVGKVDGVLHAYDNQIAGPALAQVKL